MRHIPIVEDILLMHQSNKASSLTIVYALLTPPPHTIRIPFLANDY